MAGNRSRSHLGTLTGGIFLLFLGLVLTLQALSLLPWTLWGILWRFWPVLLIVFGAGILLQRRSVWLTAMVAVVLFGGSLGIAVGLHGPFFVGSITSTTASEALGGFERAEVSIDFDAVSVDIGSLPDGSANFVRVDSEERDGQPRMLMGFSSLGDVGRLDLRTVKPTPTALRFSESRSWLRWAVDLARGIPMTIDIDMAASDLDLDLRHLDVTELTLDVDAGNYKMVLPASAGFTEVRIDANVGNVEITIPEGVAARISVDSNLSLLQIDRGRFPREGGYYQSPDYASAENRVQIDITSDVGRLRIR